LLTFVAEHPRGALADKAIFGAAAAFSRAGMVDEALAARARIWKEMPASELVARALLASASDCAAVGDFAESASMLERYFAGYRREREARRKKAGPRLYDEEKARTAVYDAALLREARGELQRAIQDRQAALQQWPKAADRNERLQAVALIRARLGEPARAARELAAIARLSRGNASLQLGSWREAARLFAEAHESDHAHWAWTELEKAYRGLPQKTREKLPPESLAAAAEAHLALGARTFDDFKRQPIQPPLMRTLNRKIDLLQRVKRRAEETVAMRQAAPAVCALAQLGEAQMLLAQSIAQSPAPRELNAEQRKLYRAALDEKARPLYEQARETLRAADTKARELGVTGTCVSQTVALLGKLGGKPGSRAQLGTFQVPLAETPDFVDASGRALPSGDEASMPSPASAPVRTTAGLSTAQVVSQPQVGSPGREK
jgi:tetratricopeptide (TPR) repeat protein